MEKKLTLEQTWKYCLAMWKWIAKEIGRNSELCAIDLKCIWLEKHPRFDKLNDDCFFCEYVVSQRNNCSQCPRKLVNKRFSCTRKTYAYDKKPIKFYQKLVELNGKRKSK